MKRLIIALWIMPLLACWAEPIALFNGKNFDGWTFDSISPNTTLEQVWSVQDGVIVCQGRPPGVLRTKENFSNYQLELEWRWNNGGNPGNSGLLVHASAPRFMHVWPKSLEVQLGSNNAGDFWMIGEKVRVANTEPQGRRFVKPHPSAEKPAGEWNHMRVRCEGNQIQVWVNGQLMHEGTDLSASSGAICLQSENGEIHFRGIVLTPLP